MAYYIDLSTISIDEYKAQLEISDMLPSRMILKEKLDERFGYFKSMGIKNVLELQKTLKKKEKLVELSQINCFSGDYLPILLREINSIHPRPVKIAEFIEISDETVSKLLEMGIKDTVGLYEFVKTIKGRKDLGNKTGIDDTVILELTSLTDLSRIKWVGAMFAKMLYAIGIDNVEKASKADYTELHKKINQLNKDKVFFKGHIGLNDMKLFVKAAKEVPLEIEY